MCVTSPIIRLASAAPSRLARRLGWLHLLALLAVAGSCAAADLESGFAAPPSAARARTWWHWMNGAVTKEGITADLEAMRSAGLGGAQIFSVNSAMRTTDGREVKGDAIYMSPRWREMVRHAVAEADRLGLVLSILNCEGFGQAGGPWVTPEDSMQRVVWTTAEVTGGDRVRLNVARPVADPLFYRDVAVLAFPTVPGDEVVAPPKISTSRMVPAVQGKAGGRQTATSMLTRATPILTMPLPMPDDPGWVLFDYGEPRTFSSVAIAMHDMRDVADPEDWNVSPYLDAQGRELLRKVKGPRYWELQASDDGRDFRAIGRIATRGTSSFAPATARYFRIWMPVPPPLQKSLPLARTEIMELTEIHLGGPRLDRPETRAAAYIDWEIRKFTGTVVPAGGAIAPNRIVDLTGKAEWDAPPGRWTLLRIGHASSDVHIGPAMVGGLDSDKLSRRAVLNHLERGTVAAVIADAGSLAGKTLRYIGCDSWEKGYENWTPLMPQEFARRRGYDLRPWLPCLTGRVVESVEASERFLWDFRRTIGDLLAENYYGTLEEYAKKRGLGVVAEATGHGLPGISDQLLSKSRIEIPQGEFWAGKGDTDDLKEAASAAHIYGKPLAASESFTASGPEFGAWKRDPAIFKSQGDLAFCLGINQIYFHTFAHKAWSDGLPGITMSRVGSNIDRTNTWWPNAGAAWFEYLGRCQFLLQQGHFIADVCYFYGEDVPVDFRFNRLNPALPAGYDFDVCNTEILGRMTVEGGRLVLPGGMRYRVLVLPDHDRMTLDTLQVIEKLVRAGATVIGPKPAKSPSLRGWPDTDGALQKLAAEVWGNCDGVKVTSHAYGKGRVIWGGSLVEAIGVPPDFATGDENLRFIHRRLGEADVYFVSNQADKSALISCTFRTAGMVPELWHPDTGRRETAAMYASNDGRTTLPLQLDPSGSVFVIFRQPATSGPALASIRSEQGELSAASASSDGSDFLAVPPISLEGKTTFAVWKPGAYELVTADGRNHRVDVPALPSSLEITGPWELRFPPNLGAPASSTLPRLMSWPESTEEGIRYFSGTATYTKTIRVTAEQLGRQSRLYLDLGTVKNVCEVVINGKNLGVLWKPPFRTDITAAARVGENQLELRVTNLWPNRLIGDKKVPPEKRVTWTTYNPYTPESPLFPSGLIGPVTLKTAYVIATPF
jgi:hypothetical protein